MGLGGPYGGGVIWQKGQMAEVGGSRRGIAGSQMGQWGPGGPDGSEGRG